MLFHQDNTPAHVTSSAVSHKKFQVQTTQFTHHICQI